jgi:hypothetical protein
MKIIRQAVLLCAVLPTFRGNNSSLFSVEESLALLNFDSGDGDNMSLRNVGNTAQHLTA